MLIVNILNKSIRNVCTHSSKKNELQGKMTDKERLELYEGFFQLGAKQFLEQTVPGKKTLVTLTKKDEKLLIDRKKIQISRPFFSRLKLPGPCVDMVFPDMPVQKAQV